MDKYYIFLFFSFSFFLLTHQFSSTIYPFVHITLFPLILVFSPPFYFPLPHPVSLHPYPSDSNVRAISEPVERPFSSVCCSIPFLPFLVYTTLSLHTRQSNAYTCARVQLHFCGWRNHSVHRPRKYARDYF